MKQIHQPGRQDGIQGLRAIACLLVLFQHAMFFATYTKALDAHPYLAVNFGRLGVSLFFVISGYVMGGCMDEGPAFILHRILRIIPPFWLAIAGSWLLLRHAQTGWHFDWPSALLVPSTSLNTTYEIPYWTLCYEMAFYAALYVMIMARLARHRVIAVCLLWILAIVLADAYRPFGFVDDPAAFSVIAQPGGWILLTPYPLFFVAGLLASLQVFDLRRYADTAQLLLAAVLLLGAASNFHPGSTVPVFLVQAVALVCVLLALKDAKPPGFLVRAGNVSYGTYLMHMVVIAAVAHALKPHAAHISLFTFWAILMLAGGLGGLAFGAVEFWIHTRLVKPGLRRLSGLRAAAA